MISIFAKPAFLNTNPHSPFESKEKSYKGNGHLQRVSSMIRGDQIANYIGAKLNPESGYEDDVCIYVKPMVRKGDDFKFEGKKAYLDIIDGHNLGQVALKHPEVGVIVCSEADRDIMSSVIPNEIVLIPQHHCNFERIKRNKIRVKTIGVIGTKDAFVYLPQGLEQALKNRGIDLLKFSEFFSRQDIIDFYQSIDVQIVWRPYKKLLSNPLKLINAASFGVPTLALDEPTFKELEGYYSPINDFDDLLYKLDLLMSDERLYSTFSEKCMVKAEEYHIENIAKLYKELDK